MHIYSGKASPEELRAYAEAGSLHTVRESETVERVYVKEEETFPLSEAEEKFGFVWKLTTGGTVRVEVDLDAQEAKLISTVPVSTEVLSHSVSVVDSKQS